MIPIPSYVEKQHIDRIFQIAAQWIGFKRTAGLVLSTLYIENCERKSGFSIRELSSRTDLSLTTVSTLCTQFESLGIITRENASDQKKRGRRTSIVRMLVGIDELLRIGMKKHLDDIDSILNDLRIYQEKSDDGTSLIFQRGLSELTLFLTEALDII